MKPIKHCPDCGGELKHKPSAAQFCSDCGERWRLGAVGTVRIIVNSEGAVDTLISAFMASRFNRAG